MNKSVTKIIKFSTIFFVVSFLFFGTTHRAEAATRTWTGTTSGAWSVASNWGGTAPVTGDDLVFPSGASNLSNTNDLTENTIFNSITFSGSGYTLSGNPIILGAGLAGITDSAASGGNTIALDVRLDVTRDIIVTNTAESLTISGRIAGVGGINKEGTGKLILSGANTFGGTLKINVGVVNARNDRALGTIAAGTEVVGGAALELQGTINIGYEALTLRGYGVSNTGALRNISNNNTFAGLITLVSAGGTEITSDSGTLTITGGMTGAFPLVIDGAGNVTFSTTPIATSTGTVTKNGVGTLTYNFPNTYTGLTTINTGTLAYGVDNAILSGAITVTGGTLDIGTYSDMVGTVTLGTLDLATGTITGTSGVLSSATYTVYNGTISAIIAGDVPGGTTQLTKSTVGTVTLTRPNQYTGAVLISLGILKIQNSTSLGTIDGATTVTAGATLQVDGSSLSVPEYITFSGTGHLYTGAIRNSTGNNTLTGLLTLGAAAMIKSDVSTTLTVDTKGLSVTTLGLSIAGDGNTTFTSSAPIYGTTATLTKDGAGTVTIQSFSNFTGTTTINGGVLNLNGSGAIPLSTTIAINAGATLTLDNSTTRVLDRIADTAAITMNGGNFNFTGSNTASTDVLETAGVLTAGIATQSGDNKITITPGSGGSSIMRFASLTRTAGSSLLFRGTSFGSTPGANISTLLFSTAPTLLGDDGAPNTPTLSIIPGAFGDSSLTGTGTDMVTYGQGNNNGLRLLNGAGFSGEYTTDLTITNANIKLTASTVASTSQINSLILSSSATITDAGSAQNITLTSGTILNLVSNATLAGANTTLTMASNVEGIIRTVSDVSLSAILATTGGVTKSGTGTLTIATAQTYTGLTSINEGTLLYGLNDSISSGNVTVNGGTFNIASFTDTVGAVILQKGTITGTSGVLTGTSYSFREGTVSAIIAGAVAVTRVATNTSSDSVVILSKNNTYSGATTITSGILKLGAAGDGINTPLGTTAGGTTIANIGALDLNGYTLSTAEAITSMNGLGFGPGATVANGNSNMGALMNSSNTAVSYSGAITLAAASRINADYGALTISSAISGAFTLTIGGFSNTELSGVIGSGAVAITKDGIGDLLLSNGNSSYTGVTTVSVGTLKIGAVSVGGTNSPLGTAGGATSITAGARLDLNGFSLGIAEPITNLNGVGYGLGDFASGAIINSSASAVTFTGLITLGSASTIKANSGDINLTAAGTITGSGFGLTLGGTGVGTISSIVGTGAGTVTKIDTGTWTLSGVSTYTGATAINLGTFKFGVSDTAGGGPLGTVAGATTVYSGAVLDLNGFLSSTLAEPLTINGRGISDGGALIGSNGTYTGTIALATDSRITNASGTMTVTGAVSGAFFLYVSGAGNVTFSTAIPTSGLSLTKQGAGTFTVTGTNLYTGETRIDAGTFAYAAGGTAVLAGTNLMMKGGTFNNATSVDTIGTVTLVGGTITNTATALTGTAYTLENGTISGVIAGAVAVTKNTNNTVTLSGVNTISSTITINAGTLTISGSGSATSVTGVTINLGGTLTLDNGTTAVADRLNGSGGTNAIVITMNGGNLNFIGNTSGTSAETMGQLLLSSGHNIVTVTPGAGGSTTLTFASNPGLSRTAGATVLFRGTSFGATPAANVSTLMFSNAPTLTGAGGAASSTTISVIKGAYGDSSLSGTGSDMVTYNVGNTNGLRLLNGAGFSGEYAGDLATANANVKLTADRVAVATNTNSLILNGFNITNPGGAITIPMSSASLAGNILINSATNIAGANTTLGITTFELNILATNTSTISAIIGTATTGSVTLSGTGNVTLSAANLYTGTTFINGATLTAGASNVISSGGVTIVGGTYNLAGNSDTVGALSINAGTITTGAGTLTGNGTFSTVANNNVTSIITGNLGLGANATFTINDGLMDNDALITAVISGAFTFAKAGSGVLELSGSNTYSGALTISGGTIRLGATGDATNTPLGTTAAGTTVSSGFSLDLNGYTLGTSEALTISGTGIGAFGALLNTSSTAVTYSGLITLGASATITSGYGDITLSNTGSMTGTGFALTLNGAGNGSLATQVNTSTAGSLVKNGSGVWTISGDGNYTGVTTVTAGTLKLGAAGGSTNNPLGTTGGATTVASGGILDLNGFTPGTSEPLTINGTGLTSNATVGALITSSGSSTSFNGPLTLGANARIANYGSGVFTLTGAISGNFALTTVTVGGITQSSASVWSGTGTLIKEGSGTLILAGQNTMSGAMTVSTGVLQLGASGGATNTPLGTNAGGVTVSSGAVLDLSTFNLGGASTYETLNLSGTGINNGGALTSSASSGTTNFGAMTVTANSRVVNSGAGTIAFTGTVTIANTINLGIGGSGPTTISGAYGASATTATLTKWDAGTLILSGINPVTGLYRVNGGTLKISDANSLAVAPVTVAGGTFDFNGVTDTIGIVSLISGTVTDSNGTPGILSIATNSIFESGTVSGVLSGTTLAIAKNTGGTVTFNKSNTYTGTTTINAGTIQYLASNIMADTSNITVTGGILDIGTNSDTVATVTLTSGAITGSSGILTGSSYAVTSGTISAILAGAVNLTKTTAGTVTLSGVNTYTGITTISGGTLSVATIGNGGAGGSNLGNASNAAANIVFNTGTGTLQYTGATASTDRAFTTTAAITMQFDITNPNTVLTWGGVGTTTTAPLTKIGQGTLKFSVAQGYTGLTTVLAGTLQYGASDTLSTGAVTVINGTFDINNFSDSVGIITLQNDGQIIDSGGTTAVLTTTGTMAAQSGTVSAVIGGSTATGITKSTSGRVILSGNNTFTSTAIALSAGYLNLRHNNALGASGTTLATTITSGAVLELQNTITLPSTKTITANGTGVNNSGAVRNILNSNAIGATVTLGSSNTRINSDSGTLTVAAVSGTATNLLVGGAGDIAITGAIATTSGTLAKDGVGTLTLTGTNTYTGTTTLTAGTTIANATAALGTGASSNTLIFNGGTLKASGTITSPSARAVTLTATAIIDTNGNSVSFAGTMGSAGGLTKNGSGTLTLTGVTTLGSDLTISAGTFVAPTTLNITGDFNNSGTYTHSNGTVTFTPDITGIVNFTGSSNTTFYNATETTAGSTVQFKAGNTYTFAHTLTLTGSNGNPISINSDTPSSQWFMTLSGSASISYVTVRDSGCSGGNNVSTTSSTIYNYGNNGSCWSFIVFGGGGGSSEAPASSPDAQQGGGTGGGNGGGNDGSNTGGSNGGSNGRDSGGDLGFLYQENKLNRFRTLLYV
ncbi:MAG: autotransporter-associated beta strand repeat-containing protein [bacterium]